MRCKGVYPKGYDEYCVARTEHHPVARPSVDTSMLERRMQNIVWQS